MKVNNLDNLTQEKYKLSKYIKDLITIYKIDSRIFTPDIWFDLTNITKSKYENDCYLGIFNLREKFRNEHNINVEKLKKIDQEIYVNNIDVLLAKIDYIQKLIDN